MLPSFLKSKNEKVLDAIRKRHSPGKTLSISRTIPNFMNGELIVIDVSKGAENLESSYVYVNDEGIAAAFINADEMSIWVSSRIKNLSFTNFYFISGSIAFAITITICALALFQIKPPDILGHALTTILGFYFGTQISQQKTKPTEKHFIHQLAHDGTNVNEPSQ